MTKYVLNSGGLGSNPEGAKKFFAELVKGLGNNPRILLFMFPQPREDWETKFAEYTERLATYLPEQVVAQYEMAQPADFSQQVASVDVVYCPGGDDHLTMYWFEKLKVAEAWQGKVVGTNSASSDALAAHFWTCDWRELKDGLGILPIKFIPHYGSAYGNDDPRGPIDWRAAKAALEAYGDASLPVHALSEGEFIVIEQ